jgi:hypothetical protein
MATPSERTQQRLDEIERRVDLLDAWLQAIYAPTLLYLEATGARLRSDVELDEAKR